MANYARMARGFVLEDHEQVRESPKELEILLSDEPAAFDATWAIGDCIAVPLRAERWRFDDKDPTIDGVKKAMPPLLRRKDVQGPRDVIYLHRTLGGIYGMLRKIDLEYPYRQLFMSHTEHAIAVAEGRVDDGTAVIGAPS